jgi:hypothetical protein
VSIKRDELEAAIRKRTGGLASPGEAADVYASLRAHRICQNCLHWQRVEMDGVPVIPGACTLLETLARPTFSCSSWTEKQKDQTR